MSSYRPRSGGSSCGRGHYSWNKLPRGDLSRHEVNEGDPQVDGEQRQSQQRSEFYPAHYPNFPPAGNSNFAAPPAQEPPRFYLPTQSMYVNQLASNPGYIGPRMSNNMAPQLVPLPLSLPPGPLDSNYSHSPANDASQGPPHYAEQLNGLGTSTNSGSLGKRHPQEADRGGRSFAWKLSESPIRTNSSLSLPFRRRSTSLTPSQFSRGYHAVNSERSDNSSSSIRGRDSATKPASSASSMACQSPGPFKNDRDPIVRPSEASGGIPDPSPAYMAQTCLAPEPSPTLRLLLVVIDLNGTLLYRENCRGAAARKFVARPWAVRFLSYCLLRFKVVIWSSARPDNVKAMLKQLLVMLDDAALKDRVVACWGRDRFGLSQEDFYQRVQCYKRLTSLWNNPVIKASHPDYDGLGGIQPWDQTNTVLIDDSLEKSRSEPHNAITLPEYKGAETEEPEVLPLVHDYLNTLAHQIDVSRYIRERPFDLSEQAALAKDKNEYTNAGGVGLDGEDGGQQH